jgi:co-chaperonin GroES (HSP10)
MNQPIQDAYVKVDERVLDPTKLPQSMVDRLPQPSGWRVLILPYKGSSVTKGGVYKPEEVVEKYALATVVGYVLRMGSEAYKDQSKFPNGPWCKEGDWVIIGRYAGARFKIEGGEVRIINDDEVIGTISDPEDIMHV